MREGKRVAVVIPALNEEQTIADVVEQLPSWVDEIVVVDNGSKDNTVTCARDAGACVVNEERRGYGSACLAGIRSLTQNGKSAPDVIGFMDGDGSDDPSQLKDIVDPILSGEYEFVLGARHVGPGESGALTPLQRGGNWLSCQLIWLFFGAQYSDLGPFRALDWRALERINMDDRGFGWTVQMQLRAARQNLKITEVPVSYRRRRGGQSKVSGSVRGAVGAGTIILSTIFIEALNHGMDQYRTRRTRHNAGS